MDDKKLTTEQIGELKALVDQLYTIAEAAGIAVSLSANPSDDRFYKKDIDVRDVEWEPGAGHQCHMDSVWDHDGKGYTRISVEKEYLRLRAFGEDREADKRISELFEEHRKDKWEYKEDIA